MSAGTALANSTVNMQLVSVSANNAGGVNTYPYFFSINGHAPVALICDTYDNEVNVGESWQANVVGLLSGKGLFGNQLMDYKAAGLIFKSILNGTLNVNVGNFAIWGLFSTNAQNNSFFQSSGAAALEQQYLALAANAPNSAFQRAGSLYADRRHAVGERNAAGIHRLLAGSGADHAHVVWNRAGVAGRIGAPQAEGVT